MTSIRFALAVGAVALGLASAAAAQDAGASAAPAAPADPATANAPPVTPQNSATPETQAMGTTTLPSGATDTTIRVSNGPVPDTAENRAKYGSPMSHAGKRTKPAGN